MNTDINKIIVASGAVIIENNRIMLNKHGDDNFWKFLGGKVKSSDFKQSQEALAYACRREAKEENGIEIDIICPLQPMMVTKSNEPGVYVVLIHWLAQRKGKISLGPDINEHRTFALDKLLAGEYKDELFAPNIKPVLRHYQDLLNRGVLNKISGK